MNILPVEREMLADRAVECATLYNAAGLEIARLLGTRIMIYPPEQYRAEMAGGVYCHTHVTGDWRPSMTDVTFAGRWDLASIRVVCLYRGRVHGSMLTRTGDHFPLIPHDEITREWTIQKRIARRTGRNEHHELIAALAARYGLVYEVTIE